MKPEYELKQLLSGSGITVSAAESCTGGMISHLITTVPGSSEYYLGSVTSYSPLVKVGVLGVPSSLIDESGIVSSAVAAAMAEGVRKLTGSTYSVATTGWADRYGDDREPAGTVWIAVSGPDGCHTTRFNSESTRSGNIRAFANKALEELVKHIG
ncbi:MAG: CinA family protein [Bacteroidales bacterium]|nr:CinA family protein [Bacteroidales bacterium]